MKEAVLPVVFFLGECIQDAAIECDDFRIDVLMNWAACKKHTQNTVCQQ